MSNFYNDFILILISLTKRMNTSNCYCTEYFPSLDFVHSHGLAFKKAIFYSVFDVFPRNLMNFQYSKYSKEVYSLTGCVRFHVLKLYPSLV